MSRLIYLNSRSPARDNVWEGYGTFRNVFYEHFTYCSIMNISKKSNISRKERKSSSIKSKWIKELHIKPETLKLIEKKVDQSH